MHARTTLIALAVTVLLLGTLLFVLPTPVEETNASAEAPTIGNRWVIRNVRTFDGKRLLPPGRLVLADGKVLAADAEVPEDAEVIDGTGLFALPGLIDAHVHTWGSARSDALRFGVTSLVDMFTAPAELQDHDEREGYARTGEAALFSAGMLATVEGGHGTQYGVAIDVLTAPGDAAAWVSAREAEGSDFIKLVYMPTHPRVPSLDLATASAVIDAAEAHELTVVAHISRHADAEALVDAGIDGFVHVFADQPISDVLLRKMVERDVFVIPTLAVIAMVDGRAPGEQVMTDPYLAGYLSEAQRAGLASDFGGRVPGFSLEIAQQNVSALHAAGVRILAGSDAPNPGTAHGATVHQELALLVESGMSTAAALRSAGALVADVFELEGRGRLEAGARADLVLIEGNPIADIAATRAVHSIFRNGFRVERVAKTDETTGATDGVPAELGAFEASLDAPEGYVWAHTSDEMMGGTSKAEVSRIESGAGDSAGALAVETTVESSFPYPWAGAYFGLTEQGRQASLADYQALQFDVRGTPERYRLMLFSANSYGAPPTRAFTVTEEWQRLRVPLDVPGFDATRFTGMAFATPMAPGGYRFEIDNVTLLRADPID